MQLNQGVTVVVNGVEYLVIQQVGERQVLAVRLPLIGESPVVLVEVTE